MGHLWPNFGWLNGWNGPMMAWLARYDSARKLTSGQRFLARKWGCFIQDVSGRKLGIPLAKIMDPATIQPGFQSRNFLTRFDLQTVGFREGYPQPPDPGGQSFLHMSTMSYNTQILSFLVVQFTQVRHRSRNATALANRHTCEYMYYICT